MVGRAADTASSRVPHVTPWGVAMMPMMPSQKEVQEYHAAINRAAEIAASTGLPRESFRLDCEVAFDMAMHEHPERDPMALAVKASGPGRAATLAK